MLIRGAPVNGQLAKNGKNPGNLNPTTIFTCPNRRHQGIWNFDADATNLGVVNVFLDQCAVMLWPSLKTTTYTPMLSSWWFSASDINGSESVFPTAAVIYSPSQPVSCAYSGLQQNCHGQLRS